MLVHRKRPRDVHWYHAGAMLFGNWGTSRLYVLGLSLYYGGRASFWYMLSMCFLLVGLGWAYQILCRLHPDGGGVYSSARHRSRTLAMIGGLLLCADYVVTAALSATDAFHYLALPHPYAWAAVSIAVIGGINYFGPRRSGLGALVIAVLTVALTLVVALASLRHLPYARLESPQGNPLDWWLQFNQIILAISGVEAVANMTGIMVEPVARTARRAILPVMIEIVALNMVLTLAMLAMPDNVLGNGNPAQAMVAHRDDMLRLLATHYVGQAFSAVAAVAFALLLLSAVNTAIGDLVSIQYMMARDGELPTRFAGLNRYGMPLVPLVIAAAAPFLVVLMVHDIAQLADLYALGVTGAVAINLGTSSTNFHLEMRSWERSCMMALAGIMLLSWSTIAWEKPHALAFAGVVLGCGLGARLVAHHYRQIPEWMLARVQRYLPTVTPVNAIAATRTAPKEAGTPTYRPETRLLVATRHNLKLLRFAVEEARLRHAELFVLFVRHIAVTAMGSSHAPDAEADVESQLLFDVAKTTAAEAGVPVRLLYAVSSDVADIILDMAVTYSAELLILGATQRGALWRTMQGDVIREVARYLPGSTSLLIHA